MRCGKVVKLRIRLHLVYNAGCANDNEMAAVVLGKIMMMYVAHQGAFCIICRLMRQCNTNPFCVHVDVEAQHDVKLSFEAKLLIWPPIVFNNDELLKLAKVNSGGEEIFEKTLE